MASRPQTDLQNGAWCHNLQTLLCYYTTPQVRRMIYSPSGSLLFTCVAKLHFSSFAAKGTFWNVEPGCASPGSVRSVCGYLFEKIGSSALIWQCLQLVLLTQVQKCACSWQRLPALALTCIWMCPLDSLDYDPGENLFVVDISIRPVRFQLLDESDCSTSFPVLAAQFCCRSTVFT